MYTLCRLLLIKIRQINVNYVFLTFISVNLFFTIETIYILFIKEFVFLLNLRNMYLCWWNDLRDDSAKFPRRQSTAFCSRRKTYWQLHPDRRVCVCTQAARTYAHTYAHARARTCVTLSHTETDRLDRVGFYGARRDNGPPLIFNRGAAF